MGFPTASLFAKNDFQVMGVDINPETAEKINLGISPIMEPGLDILVKEVVSKNLLSATTDGEEAVKNANIIIIIVPTPVDESTVLILQR